MVSSHNPFRTPTVTPTPTGASSSRTPPSSPPGPSALGDIEAREETHVSASPVRSQQTETAGPSTLDRSVNDLLTEELPPAYTPAPNVYEGEATIEFGPRRPFQAPVPVPPQNQPQWMAPQPTGSWTSFPGSMHRESSNIYTRPVPPPPVHPSRRDGRPSSAPLTPPAHLSDFARDFYAAGSGANAGVLGGPSSRYEGETPGASSSSPSNARYAPPPGEPPNRGAKGAPVSPAAPPARDSVPDDGRPTDKPVPGHPLLRYGCTLVYPRDYECQKCRNTGYKNYDPSHPCSRCWGKYSRPYSGAMAYAPWSPEGPSSVGSSRSTFQRPLPQFRAPQASLHQQSASYSGPLLSPRSDLSRSSSTSRVGSGYPGATGRVIPVGGGGVPMSPYLDPLQGRGNSVFPPPSWYGSPSVVNGAPSSSGNVAVYPPGDPRIGGRLCWRCGGSGKTSFLIFDEETCRVCNGIGRTFV
ncbi:hypothetical protein C8Q79DRAFT_1121998 [Trametes meyenii]|nr:hypothetical protein C8Q79DRAFT_1121998 [Trametes meyenii]